MKLAGEMTRRLLLVCMVMCILSAAVAATDYYVDDDGSNSNNGLTPTAAFLTITYAMSQASAGDSIYILKGTYDAVGHGETFPISIKDGVDVIGYETLEADWPRIGGDVADSAVNGLFEVDASSGDMENIDIRLLYFVGEDTTNEDAPSALYVKVRGGYTAEVVFESNTCERSEMDDDTNDDRATIMVDLGWGTADVTILDNTIEATARGGVEVVTLGTDTTSVNESIQDVTVEGNTITVDTDENAEFGIQFLAEGDLFVDMMPNIVDNVIDSAANGITTGVKVALITTGDDSSITATHGDFFLYNNTIKGCVGDGIWLLSDSDHIDSAPNMSCFDLYGNDVRNNGVAALRIDRGVYEIPGPPPVEVATGYITIHPQGNMFVDNQYGVWTHGTVDTGDDPKGESWLLNDTIAGNTYEGLYIEDHEDNGPNSIINCIVWGNNSGAAQSGGGTTWSRLSSSVLVEHTDWQTGTTDCTPDSDNNLSCDPEFVDSANGDYHIASDSPCMEAGDNTPENGELTDYDIDGDSRGIDGDQQVPRVVDMGADEYDPS